MFTLFSVKAANMIVRPPTLPKNIRIIKIKRETAPRSAVIPSESPTVPIADAVSKSAGRMGIHSTRLIIIAPNVKRNVYIRNIVAAIRTAPPEILRLKSWVFSFLRNTDMAEENNTAMVVVFIPPAVEPGDPPMSISTMVSIWPVSLKSVKSEVLKPAVLVVTE